MGNEPDSKPELERMKERFLFLGRHYCPGVSPALLQIRGTVLTYAHTPEVAQREVFAAEANRVYGEVDEYFKRLPGDSVIRLGMAPLYAAARMSHELEARLANLFEPSVESVREIESRARKTDAHLTSILYNNQLFQSMLSGILHRIRTEEKDFSFVAQKLSGEEVTLDQVEIIPAF